MLKEPMSEDQLHVKCTDLKNTIQWILRHIYTYSTSLQSRCSGFITSEGSADCSELAVRPHLHPSPTGNRSSDFCHSGVLPVLECHVKGFSQCPICMPTFFHAQQHCLYH